MSTDSQRIEEERRAKFCGTASIRLDAIRYKTSFPNQTGVQESTSVASLKILFREELESCQAGGKYRAKVLIRQEDLEKALNRSEISIASLIASLFPHPKLEIPSTITLECLQGHDRLVAAEEVLEGSQKRWDVDIFLDDLSVELKKKLVEDFEYKKEPSDGEFYRKIREYQGVEGEANAFFEKLWRGRLAVSPLRKNFEELDNHKGYTKAFNTLLQVPALFDEHIYQWWHEICEGDSNLMRQIDKDTVKSLQGKAPGASHLDRDELSSLFRSGKLFTEIPEEYRETLWSRVCDYSTQCLIPSLFTFFEDRKFLENVACGLRNIVGVESKDSISRRLTDMFTDIGQVQDRCVVQVSDIRFGSTAGNRDSRLRLGMQQLWLAAFREYENLPVKLQRKNVLAKARPRVDVGALHGLASVALRLGFESDEIHEILSHSADWVIASEALLAARKPGSFEYDNLDQLATQIAGIFAKARPVASETRRMQTYTNRSKKPARHGLPDAADHAYDKLQLFLPNIGGDIDNSRNHVTSLFVRMSVYRAYFGQSTLSPALSQEVLISSVPAQENDGRNHNVPEVGSGLDHEIQIMEEAITLQQLKSDTAMEMEKLTELKQQVSREQAALAVLRGRSKAERNSCSSRLAFDDIVAEKYDEFMADEEPVQDKGPVYDKSAISLQEEAEELAVASSAGTESFR
ncbi:hypothetical protein ARSEF4850_007825 [Beauveria asiatica]